MPYIGFLWLKKQFAQSYKGNKCTYTHPVCIVPSLENVIYLSKKVKLFSHACINNEGFW